MHRPMIVCTLALAACIPGVYAPHGYTFGSAFCVACADLMYRPMTACTLGLAMCMLHGGPTSNTTTHWYPFYVLAVLSSCIERIV